MRHLAHWLACCGLCTLPVHADRLQLVNGDRLTGDIVTLEADTLTVDTEHAGRLKLPWSAIAGIESETRARVRLDDGREYDATFTTHDGGLALRFGSLDLVAPVAAARIVAINPPARPDRIVYSGRARVGGNLARGNTEQSSLHVSGELAAENPALRLGLKAEVNEAEQNGTNSASNWRLGLKTDFFLDGREHYAYLETGFASDRRAGLDLRSTLGAGAGRVLLARGKTRIALEGGASLVHEGFAAAPDTRFPGARAALVAETEFFDGRLGVFHTSELLANLDDTSDTLYLGRLGLRVPMNERIGLTAQLSYDHDSLPAPGKQSTDTALVLGVDATL